MQLTGDQLILSASDLNNYLACPHLTALDLRRARGEEVGERQRGAEAELLAAKGDAHELDYLRRLKEAGREVVELDSDDGSPAGLAAAVAATEEAMGAGAEVIYQGAFLRDGLRGHTDFLFRVDRPSALGGHSYEVADTKLARHAKPYFILQLCFYSDLLAAVQGVEPEMIHVILGDGEQRCFRLAEFAAYFRRVRTAFLAEISNGIEGTYPEPVSHCSFCQWRGVCEERREADDHLSLVAGISRGQRERLVAAGVSTLEALGSAAPAVDGIDPGVLERLHRQAALQLRGRRSGDLHYELKGPEPERGFERLPRPSPGDVFFDMEGDPFYDEAGLEYLFGYVTAGHGDEDADAAGGDSVGGAGDAAGGDGAGGSEFTAIWGRDRVEERQALEQFVDRMTARRERYPDLHIYHYGHYEVTALKRLAGAHGTREEELDELLRGEVFVDLYKVVREALLISQPSYSIKKVESFYMGERQTEVADGGDSVVEFERWLERRDDSILDAIAAYNRDDCVSTLRLRDWLLGLREEQAARLAREGAEPPAWFGPRAPELSEVRLARREENEALMRRLLEGVPEEGAERDAGQQARWLMAQLLEYHHREARPVYWAMFARMEAEPHELVDDPDCVGRLEGDASVPPRKEKRSRVHRLRFPVQETKLRAGAKVRDARDGERAGTIVSIDVDAGWLELKRGPTLADRPLPEALIPPGPYGTREQQGALRRLAEAVLEGGPERYAAARRILRREPLPLRGEELPELAAGLDGSYLFVQGPPGSGKTYSGARLIAELIAAGSRVGVTATSHKAIHNLLGEVEEVAAASGLSFRGLKKCSKDSPETRFDSEAGLIESVDDNAALNDPGVALTAGTAWHYCREDTAQLDYLVIDEAGQVSLADALAMATAARNVILLGDPQQLPQVSQAAHPEGSSLSVLEHLLGPRQTVAEGRGVFLAETWRMHPDVAGFVSELMYDGRLRSAPGRERQRIVAEGPLGGTGLRWLPVAHEGRTQSAPEEAERIAAAVEGLLGGGAGGAAPGRGGAGAAGGAEAGTAETAGARVIDAEGRERPLEPADILVLAPYNAQVQCLAERLPAGVQVGTVDKMQGRQAEVAFYSLATSSGDDVPRNVEFLFSRNRFNVAISRARCLSVLACNPRLLDIRATSIEQMRLVNALCRFTELAHQLD